MTLHTRRRSTDPMNESGQTMSEYSVLVAAIALVVILALPQLESPISGFFAAVAQAVKG